MPRSRERIYSLVSEYPDAMQQVANRRRSTWLPPDCFRGPVVLLDSGRSLAESHFAERMRKWLLDELASRPSSRARHNCYLAYPDEKAMFRYGAFPTSEYDEYEVRPIRTGGRALDPGGVFATMAAFEEGLSLGRDPSSMAQEQQEAAPCDGCLLEPQQAGLEVGVEAPGEVAPLAQHSEPARWAVRTGEDLAVRVPANRVPRVGVERRGPRSHRCDDGKGVRDQASMGALVGASGDA